MLNPKFVYFSPRHSAGTPITEHVDHAIIALDGRAPLGGGFALERLEPVFDAETLRIELWVNDLDDYTCTYGFLVSNENGRTPFARGERTVASIDPASHCPQKWSRSFVSTHAELLKDLPAYA